MDFSLAVNSSALKIAQFLCESILTTLKNYLFSLIIYTLVELASNLLGVFDISGVQTNRRINIEHFCIIKIVGTHTPTNSDGHRWHTFKLTHNLWHKRTVFGQMCSFMWFLTQSTVITSSDSLKYGDFQWVWRLNFR